MQNGSITWGSDVPVSMPDPVTRHVYVPMGGFAFTIRGLAHDLTTAELEYYMIPNRMPDYWGLAGSAPGAE